jgi:hypothetical protein
MTPQRDVRELVGDDLPPEELARLESVHRLILEAGPPPELPPTLARPPAEASRGTLVSLLPRRRRSSLLLVAAAALVAAFALGYLTGGRNGFHTVFVPKPMVGTGADRGAYASLKVGKADAGGNWPIQMRVTGLPKLPPSSYYVLYVSKGARPIVPCGSFRVNGGITTVHMSAAYNHDALGWDAWVVTVERHGQREPGRVVMVTKA